MLFLDYLVPLSIVGLRGPNTHDSTSDHIAFRVYRHEPFPERKQKHVRTTSHQKYLEGRVSWGYISSVNLRCSHIFARLLSSAIHKHSN